MSAQDEIGIYRQDFFDDYQSTVLRRVASKAVHSSLMLRRCVCGADLLTEYKNNPLIFFLLAGGGGDFVQDVRDAVRGV